MELYAKNGVRRVLYGHHLAVGHAGRYLQAGGDGIRVRGKAVVAGHGHLRRQARKQRGGGIQLRHALLAVHQLPGKGHGSAERFADGLVPQADAQNREPPAQLPDHLDADACIFRPAGAGGEDNARRVQRGNLFHRHGVVADDPDVRFQRTDELVQVIGKAVIVIDQQDHASSASSACSMARTTAFALLMHSRYSLSGTESATMPAPLRTNTLPFFL